MTSVEWEWFWNGLKAMICGVIIGALGVIIIVLLLQC